jgi:hypothetical protein
MFYKESRFEKLLMENYGHQRDARAFEAERVSSERITRTSTNPVEIHDAYHKHPYYETSFNAVRNPNTAPDTIRKIYHNSGGNFAKHIFNHPNTPLDVREHIRLHNPNLD